jgi:O-antigen ligase
LTRASCCLWMGLAPGIGGLTTNQSTTSWCLMRVVFLLLCTSSFAFLHEASHNCVSASLWQVFLVSISFTFIEPVGLWQLRHRNMHQKYFLYHSDNCLFSFRVYTYND